MRHDARTSLLRGPLLVVVLFVLALIALFPIATLRAQTGPASPGLAPVTSVARADTVDGEVSDMFVRGRHLEVHYRNTGSVVTELLGEVQVRTADDSLVATVPLVEARRIEAGKRETFRIAMPDLPPGKYTLYAVVDFGGRELTAAQAALEIRR